MTVSAKTRGSLLLPLYRMLYWGTDRYGSPFVALVKRDPRSSKAYPLCHGRAIKVAWGAWWCYPTLGRKGLACGRLWVDWV